MDLEQNFIMILWKYCCHCYVLIPLPEIRTDRTRGVLARTCSEPRGKMQYSLINCLTSPKHGVGSTP